MALRGEMEIFADAGAVARAAAEHFVRHVAAAVATRGRFTVALAGGGTPERTYRLLAEEPFRSAVPWRQVHLFWGDERAVRPGHPRSNFRMAARALIARVPIPAGNVHRIPGELGARRAAEAYEADLRTWFSNGAPRFDLVHLGLGEDGHTASLFPFGLVLRERDRWVAATRSPAGEPRITLTPPVLDAAAHTEFLAVGTAKAGMVRAVAAGALDPFRLPAQGVRPRRGSLRWTVDAAAAALLPTKTAADAAPATPAPDTNTQRMALPNITPEEEIARIARGEHPDPFAVLGMHRVGAEGAERLVLRTFQPPAAAVQVIPAEAGEAAGSEAVSLRRAHVDGFFHAAFPSGTEPFRYRLRLRDEEGRTWETADPYAFPPTLGDLDLHLLGEGTDRRMYHKLGAHPHTLDGVDGVRFAVWAPNAFRVSVVGGFNAWDGRAHPMRHHPGVGVWELFIPDLGRGEAYKFEIKSGADSPPFLKSDPVAFQAELRPETASLVYGLGSYAWGDGEWMQRRGQSDPAARPMSIYEVHPGSWRHDADARPLAYRELAPALAEYAVRMGFTHVEFLPVMEHPYDPSWGYQVTGYFAATSRFGTPDDFRFLVDHLHQRGIGVLLDWVPAHFPKDAHALRRFDGTALYEHADPRQGEHPDWGTLIFNFGRNEVRNFLIANALFWLDEFHADGLRVDAVASMLYLDYSRKAGEWLPNPQGGRENLDAIHFLRELNRAVREQCPGALMIAEESTAWPGVTQSVELGGLGFHFKWNMGWMNDFLRFMEEDPVYRKFHFSLLTFSLMYAFSERFVLPISHDEVVHGKRSLLNKMPGDPWRKFANLRLALGFMWGHPGKQLLFMGSELAEPREWSEGRALDWPLLEHPLHGGMQRWLRDLNALYRREEALWQCDTAPDGFEWIDFRDVENTVLSFLRRGVDPELPVVFVCNFTPIPRRSYRIGVPVGGTYRELLNSDAEMYGGSNVGNGGAVAAEPVQAHGHPFSLCLTLPPLGILILKPEGTVAEPDASASSAGTAGALQTTDQVENDGQAEAGRHHVRNGTNAPEEAARQPEQSGRPGRPAHGAAQLRQDPSAGVESPAVDGIAERPGR